MTDDYKKPKGAGKSSFELINQDKLTDMLPLKPESTVLDLGCGRGTYGFKKIEAVDIGEYNYLMSFQETDLYG